MGLGGRLRTACVALVLVVAFGAGCTSSWFGDDDRARDGSATDIAKSACLSYERIYSSEPDADLARREAVRYANRAAEQDAAWVELAVIIEAAAEAWAGVFDTDRSADELTSLVEQIPELEKRLGRVCLEELDLELRYGGSGERFVD